VAKSTLNLLLTRLRQLRERHELSQEGFAEMSGISYKYYQAVEAGRKRELRLSTLERLAKAYGIEVHELLSPEMPRTKISRKHTSKAR
jgi:transcriptional regulator with XRE-family HTH domain